MKKIASMFSAAALVLAGDFLSVPMPAMADALNVNAQTGTTYTFLNSDCSKLVSFSNASVIAATLPQASSASGGGAAAGTFVPPCDIKVVNNGAGTVTITPTTSTIGGDANLVLTTNQSAEITSDGANYQAFLFGPGTALPLVTFGSAGGVPTHIATAQLTAPALTSCGTGSPAITGTDEAGIVTLGTSATGCVITFNVAYTGTPFCVVSWIATPLASQSYVTAASTITLTQTSASGNKVQYICRAPSGG